MSREHTKQKAQVESIDTADENASRLSTFASVVEHQAPNTLAVDRFSKCPHPAAIGQAFIVPVSSVRGYTQPREEKSAATVVQITGTSHLLNAEELRLRHGLSQAELASILTMAGTMFRPTCAHANLPEVVKRRKDMGRWEEAIGISSEHDALRAVVKCRQRRKRDSETKMAIQGLHPEIDRRLREGYLKAVRRLEAFQEATMLPFPPNCGVFWNGRSGTDCIVIIVGATADINSTKGR